MKLKLPRGICKVCGKETALRRPTGCWLDDLYPRRHFNREGRMCDGCVMKTEMKTEISREPAREKQTR